MHVGTLPSKYIIHLRNSRLNVIAISVANRKRAQNLKKKTVVNLGCLCMHVSLSLSLVIPPVVNMGGWLAGWLAGWLVGWLMLPCCRVFLFCGGCTRINLRPYRFSSFLPRWDASFLFSPVLVSYSSLEMAAFVVVVVFAGAGAGAVVWLGTKRNE